MKKTILSLTMLVYFASAASATTCWPHQKKERLKNCAKNASNLYCTLKHEYGAVEQRNLCRSKGCPKLGKGDFKVGADSDETDWLEMEGCVPEVEKEAPPPKAKAHKPK